MYVQYDINIIAILILVVVLVNNFKNSGESIVKRWLFRAFIVSDILLLLIDMIILIIYGKPGPVVHVMLEVLQSFFFTMCSLFCFFWALYCTVRTGYSHSGLKLLILCLPFLVLVVFLFANYGNGLIFVITRANTYERGAFFHITSVCTYCMLFFRSCRCC